MLQNQPIYYASANTCDGFLNYFGKVFDPNRLQRIYIIKGGPGSGKSSLIRRIASRAVELEEEVELFLCSSDPDSFDGVILSERKIAVIDGTSPHLAEPNYPGAVETILNTGAYWNKSRLMEQKQEILELTREKKRYYKRAYHFLKAMGEINREIAKVGEEALNKEKMNSFLGRITARCFTDKDAGKTEIRLIGALNRNGKSFLSTFESAGDTVYVVEDNVFSGYFFLDRLFQAAQLSHQEMKISYSCLFPERINGIHFPQSKCSFILGERCYEKEIPEKEYHYINMNRFLDRGTLQSHKQKIRFGNRCSETLLSGARDAFQEASNRHFDLERIYVSSTDFLALTHFAQEVTEEIFSEIQVQD